MSEVYIVVSYDDGILQVFHLEEDARDYLNNDWVKESYPEEGSVYIAHEVVH